MCPQCEKCSTWTLHNICAYTRISYLFDNPGTVFYAVFMSFWGQLFLEYWKRKNASLAHQWDCMGFTEEDEKPRPHFAANAPYLEKNPITGIREPSFPSQVRLRRIAAGGGLILVMVNLTSASRIVLHFKSSDKFGSHLHIGRHHLQNPGSYLAV